MCKGSSVGLNEWQKTGSWVEAEEVAEREGEVHSERKTTDLKIIHKVGEDS
jgi:hypothetical protein